MFKKIATSVKSAITSSKQQQQQTPNVPDESKKNSIRDRINLEKELNRKNQRSKLINECRLNGHQKNESNKSNLNNSNLISKSDLALNTNYALKEVAKSDRKKDLELWRKDQREKNLSIKDNRKPVFKVQSVGPKLFESKSMSDMKSAKNSSLLDSSRGFKFHELSLTKHTSHITETSHGKLSRQNSKTSLHEHDRYHFGAPLNHKSFVPKFTFAINLDTLDVQKTSISSNNNNRLPKNSTPCTSSASFSSKTNLNKNKHETSPKLEAKKLTDHKNKKLNMDACNLKKEAVNRHESLNHPPITRSKAAELKTRSNNSTTDSKEYKQLATSISITISSSSLISKPVAANSKTSKPVPPTKTRTISSIAGASASAHMEHKQLVSKKIVAVEKPVEKTPIKPKTNVQHLATSTTKELISTPKNTGQKEELAKEFKKLNLSVKKTIKHFEELSNSLNTSNTTTPTSITTTTTTTIDISNDENELSVKYFRKLIETKTEQLLDLSDQWCLIRRDQAEAIPDSIQGDIRSTCGLAKLLMEERFKQFAELIDQCELTNTNMNSVDPEIKIVKCTDLQGFWEMINHQVKDVENQFAKLARIKENNYLEEQLEFVPKVKKIAIRKAISVDASSTTKIEAKENAKPVVKSKFSEFRAKLKAKPVEMDSITPNIEQVVLTEVNINVVEVVSEMPLAGEQQEQQAPKIKKRPVVRSRPSDLIKFDSPVPAKKNSYNEEAIAEDSEDENNINKSSDMDKENDPFDFESFVPIGWNKNSRESVVPPSFSPKTPSRSVNDRKSQFNDLVNSPLLKLALVSSHGKSKSGRKN